MAGFWNPTGSTGAQIKSALLNIWFDLALRGIKVYQTTITPHTSSTDGWTTLANQTPVASESIRVDLNDWIRAGAPIDGTTFAAVAVGTSNALLAGTAGHPLAGAQALTPADLAAQKCIGVVHKEGVRRHDNFVAACAEAGFVPNIAVEASEPLAALGLVAAGLGVTMVQRSLRQQAPDGLVLHEVPWLDYRASLWVAWHRVALRPLVTHFRGLLERSRLIVPVEKVEALAA